MIRSYQSFFEVLLLNTARRGIIKSYCKSIIRIRLLDDILVCETAFVRRMSDAFNPYIDFSRVALETVRRAA